MDSAEAKARGQEDYSNGNCDYDYDYLSRTGGGGMTTNQKTRGEQRRAARGCNVTGGRGAIGWEAVASQDAVQNPTTTQG